MRLDKLLANLKYGSRKEIKQLIKKKLVLVNDEVIKDSSIHVNPEQDQITVAGEVITYKEHVYFMMHKPAGVISATTDLRHKTVIDLLSGDDLVYDVFPCGRLDIDTEGLIILSNDGQFAHQMLHPKKEINKVYYAEIEGHLTIDDQMQFSSGMEILDGQSQPYTTKPAKLEIIRADLQSQALVTIYEGKFHQVKRMFEHVGKRVTYLKRLAIGQLRLDEQLTLGQYREMNSEELELLFINELNVEENENG